MDKQKLAATIWASANQMRSKIEASEYKDYILGFIFYKYLSDTEVALLKKDGWTEEDLKELTEDDADTVKYCREKLGYFISYDYLFSTWRAPGNSAEVGTVTDALSAFERLINPDHKKLFGKIFDTLSTGLSKLGDTAGKQSTAINNLLALIEDIPTDGRQGYDVLGFIYEYLISNFAANAGKKAGEFYTPHEVSVLMAELVANHLKDRDRIEIYDPTSGSGSLLLNIGKAVAKHLDADNCVKYYAQELKENTYNLTRMNLVMRGILPSNIVTRCGDTLEEDWPFFEEGKREQTYSALHVDAVVSNPPYSQAWTPKPADTRFSEYGTAPKSKADYAFLLHDLFHLKSDGIMTIVLPHGVLFRGGEEERIRRNLIEKNHIDAIIGLPSNIFFGTGIPTIVMVLRQHRDNTDVMIVDASKGFVKEGKNNKLRASDIRRIADAVISRATIDKFSRKVERKEIRENGYNLNIPRYVDSSDASESWDIYSTIFGGIPESEVNGFSKYWNVFPTLKDALFEKGSIPYYSLKTDDISATVRENNDVASFITGYNNAFKKFSEYLKTKLISDMEHVNIAKGESEIAADIFSRVKDIPLVDKYNAYQMLDDAWQLISSDLEIIQTEGKAVIRQVDPHMVEKKKGDETEEVQDGYVGHIIPFELVQKTLLKEDLQVILDKEADLLNINEQYTEIIDSFSEEEKDGTYLNDDNTAFVSKEVKAKLKEIYANIESPEIEALKQYTSLLDSKAKKDEKLKFIQDCHEIAWEKIEKNKDGTVGKTNVNSRIKDIISSFEFPADSFEAKLVLVESLIEKEKTEKAEIKELSKALHEKTKLTIESLSDEDANMLIDLKWNVPLINSIREIPNDIIKQFISEICYLAHKYDKTLSDITDELAVSSKKLSEMINDLDGNEFDLGGLEKLKSILEG